MRKGESLVNRFCLYGAPLLLVQLAIGCAPAAPDNNATATDINMGGSAVAANASAVEESALVVAFGDSLFAGYGLDQGQGFVPELERALTARGLKARVVSAAVSGDTSAGGLQRLDFALDGMPRKPDLVIVGLGGNDMLRGLDPQATRANMEAILEKLKARGIRAMLTGMLASPNMGADYAAAFDPIYPELARKFGVPLYPFTLDGVIGRKELLLPDGIHPNEKGVERIVSGIAPMVSGELHADEQAKGH